MVKFKNRELIKIYLYIEYEKNNYHLVGCEV
jgi:hypothetical protein